MFLSNDVEKSFLRVLSISYQAGFRHGNRSNKKLVLIHRWFGAQIRRALGEDYSVKSLGVGENRAATMEGKYYPKSVDIAVLKAGRFIAAISFKFVAAHCDQNTSRCFDGMLAEAANIRRAGVGFAHFVVLRGHTPHYEKVRGVLNKTPKKIDKLSEADLLKYIKLFDDVDFPHKPEALGLAVVDFNCNGQARRADLHRLQFGAEMINILETKLAVASFIKKVVALCQLKA